MLTQMGITSWKLQGPEVVVAANNLPESQSSSNKKLESEKGLPKAISQFKNGHGVAQTKVQAIPGQLLLLMSSEQAEHQLVADILQAAGFQATHTRTIVEQAISHFKEFDFAWQIGQNLELSGSILTTPPLEKMQRWDLKQQLWKILSTHEPA